MAHDVAVATALKTGCISLSGNISADDTVRIGDVQYTFKADPSSANEVDVGSDADESLENLAKAINASGTAGTEYGSGTEAHPYVSASADTDNDELDLTARTVGDYVNHLALAASGSNVSAGAATLGAVSGGTDGAGDLSDLFQDLIDMNQINAELEGELNALVRS